MSEVELNHRTFFYADATIVVALEYGGGWSWWVVIGEERLQDDEQYVNWQAARANAMLAYEHHTGKKLGRREDG